MPVATIAVQAQVIVGPSPSTNKGSTVFEMEMARLVRLRAISQLILTPSPGGWAVQIVLERTLDVLTLVSLRREIRHYKDIDRLFNTIRKHGPLPSALILGDTS